MQERSDHSEYEGIQALLRSGLHVAGLLLILGAGITAVATVLACIAGATAHQTSPPVDWPSYVVPAVPVLACFVASAWSAHHNHGGWCLRLTITTAILALAALLLETLALSYTCFGSGSTLTVYGCSGSFPLRALVLSSEWLYLMCFILPLAVLVVLAIVGFKAKRRINRSPSLDRR